MNNIITQYPETFTKNEVVSKAELTKENKISSATVFEAIRHEEVLSSILGQIEPLDFRKEAELNDGKESLSNKHFVVSVVDNVLRLAHKNNWSICRSNENIYVYNGAYWKILGEGDLQAFLGEAAERMGVDRTTSRFHQFRDHLVKQFLAIGHLNKPEPKADVVLINLLNGTFEVTETGPRLRPPSKGDFLTYQLPFIYDKNAECPAFMHFLNRVQPDIQRQKILGEYLAYLFTSKKLEKVLILFGSGANGKSVFFEIVNALLGSENVSSYSLQSLTQHNSYQRAHLANKLLNYASEINGNLEASIFKQLASGEPVEAREIYKQPFMMSKYAKLIFNCNELPKDVEHTPAYFRRFLIVPFDVVIPESEQDNRLARKIIDTELSGVFNWVLEGLVRLISQDGFTASEAVTAMVDEYKKQSDSTQLFTEDAGYKPGDFPIPLKEMYAQYRAYCSDGGYKPCSQRGFSDRLRNAGFEIDRKNSGRVVYLKKVL